MSSIETPVAPNETPQDAGVPKEDTANVDTTQPVDGLLGDTGKTIICDRIRTAAEKAKTTKAFYRKSLRELAHHFDSPYATLVVESSTGVVSEAIKHDSTSDEQWKEICDTLLLEARYREEASAKLYTAANVSIKLAAMGLPLQENGLTVGAVVVVVPSATRSLAEGRLRELQALVGMISSLSSGYDKKRTKTQSANAATSADTAGISKSGEYESLHEFAYAMTNGLKSKLELDHVSIGFVRGQQVEVLSASGFDELQPRNPGVRIVQQVMEECLDAGRDIIYQEDSRFMDDSLSTGHLLHKQWHLQTGCSAVASVPLFYKDKCAAVLSLRNRASRPFSENDLARVRQAVQPVIPGLVLMERANRHPFTAMRQLAKETVADVFAKSSKTRGLLAAVAVALLCWITFGTAPYRITVPCTVVSQNTLHVAAPFQGTILAAHCQPGDAVQAGQLLVQFDTNELVVERIKMAAELRILQVALTQALESKDNSAAAQAGSQLEITRSKIQILDSRISRANVVAPQDGIILSGDPTSRIGEVVPLGEPLISVSSSNQLRVDLQLPQTSAPHVASGQSGYFVTNSRPDQQLTVDVQRVHLSSSIVENDAVYVAEGELQQQPTWLRTGMTGYAKIKTKPQRLWWIGTHKFLDSIRLRLWKL